MEKRVKTAMTTGRWPGTLTPHLARRTTRFFQPLAFPSSADFPWAVIDSADGQATAIEACQRAESEKSGQPLGNNSSLSKEPPARLPIRLTNRLAVPSDVPKIPKISNFRTTAA